MHTNSRNLLLDLDKATLLMRHWYGKMDPNSQCLRHKSIEEVLTSLSLLQWLSDDIPNTNHLTLAG